MIISRVFKMYSEGLPKKGLLAFQNFSPFSHCDRPIERLIDLFTDTAAILNLLVWLASRSTYNKRSC